MQMQRKRKQAQTAQASESVCACWRAIGTGKAAAIMKHLCLRMGEGWDGAQSERKPLLLSLEDGECRNNMRGVKLGRLIT